MACVPIVLEADRLAREMDRARSAVVGNARLEPAAVWGLGRPSFQADGKRVANDKEGVREA